MCESTNCTGCPIILGYQTITDYDHLGDNLGRAANATAAAAICFANLNCKGCNNAGWYKDKISPMLPVAGSCFYIKRECVPVRLVFRLLLLLPLRSGCRQDRGGVSSWCGLHGSARHSNS